MNNDNNRNFSDELGKDDTYKLFEEEEANAIFSPDEPEQEETEEGAKRFAQKLA